MKRLRLVRESAATPLINSATTAPKFVGRPLRQGTLLVLCLILSIASQSDFAVRAAGHSTPQTRRRPPNILLILVDDLGREWFGSYGGEGDRTPNIDRLAASGIRFENAYATPLCTPSRHEMLTGRYPFRTGWTTHHDTPRWGGQNFDPQREVSLARVLKSAGYRTGVAGKWQVNDLRVGADILKQHGFDEHCVWVGAEADSPRSTSRYWDPLIQINNARPPLADRFGPDVLSDFIVDFMRRHKAEPFFAYYPMVLTHQPFTTTPRNKDAALRDKELFPGMVEYADHQVGRLMDSLDELGLRENTVVILTTDNGSPAGVSHRAWNREMRGGKAKLTEAGIHVPFIVSLPPSARGTSGGGGGRVTDALIDFSDVLPTLADMAGAKLPKGVTLDGRSFAALLSDGTARRRSVPQRAWIFSQYGETRVVRDKRFKLYSTGAFYDLKADPFEETDMAKSANAEAAAARRELERVLRSLPAANAVLPSTGGNVRRPRQRDNDNEQ